MADFIVQVSTVVVCFDCAGWVRGVGVEGVEVGADALWWGEVLDCAGAGFEGCVFE